MEHEARQQLHLDLASHGRIRRGEEACLVETPGPSSRLLLQGAGIGTSFRLGTVLIPHALLPRPANLPGLGLSRLPPRLLRFNAVILCADRDEAFRGTLTLFRYLPVTRSRESIL